MKLGGVDMGEFEYSGGALCLDFANTWGNRSDAAKDRLAGYDDLLRWAAGSGTLSDAERAELEKAARRSPEKSTAVFAEAVVIRESLFRICDAVAREVPPAAADLEVLNRALAAMPQRRLCRGGACCEWRWPESLADLHRILWPVIRSAADLLTSPDAERIRQCEAPDCSWLFLDRSRGGRRRWCDMSSCGNRAKARRYYERHHQQNT
jgi:predicted RNA-binding Zn ribbon-like protein